MTISIHTPAKGVTDSAQRVRAHREHFNPHSREGSDQDGHTYKAKSNVISIHTPAKGVTAILPNFRLYIL